MFVDMRRRYYVSTTVSTGVAMFVAAFRGRLVTALTDETAKDSRHRDTAGDGRHDRETNVSRGIDFPHGLDVNVEVQRGRSFDSACAVRGKIEPLSVKNVFGSVRGRIDRRHDTGVSIRGVDEKEDIRSTLVSHGL